MPASKTTGGAVGIEADADRIAARRDGVDLALQQAPQHHDALVAGREVLVGMEGDRPLPDLRLPVARELLVLLLRQVGPELAVDARALGAELALLALTRPAT